MIWNNGSTDGTRDYLDSLDDPRMKIVHSEENIGQNGYARGVRDDLVRLPRRARRRRRRGAAEHWDLTLRDAYRRLPAIGFLAADIEDDPHDEAAHYRYRVRPHEYTPSR